MRPVSYTHLVTVLTGACYSIKSVTLTDLATIDRFDFWPVFGIGKTKEEYEEYLKAHPVDEAHAYSHLAIATNATVAALGLTAVAQHDGLEILYTDEDTYNAYRDLHILSLIHIFMSWKSLSPMQRILLYISIESSLIW